MQQWQYKYVQVELEGGAAKGITDNGTTVNLSGYSHHVGYLNKLGREGWELVSVVQAGNEHWFYLRQPGSKVP